VPEEEELNFSRNGERGSGKTILALALLVLVAGAGFYIFTPNSSVRNAYSSIKESTQDATTTSRVRTALLLSKHGPSAIFLHGSYS
jgi:ABC-type microcin C transport system duplicated ATPase subunit YejF